MNIWLSNEDMAALHALAKERGELVEQTARELICHGLAINPA